MPRDAVAITGLTSGAGTANPAGTAINPANNANIAGAKDTTKLVVRLTNTAGAEKSVTFKNSNQLTSAGPTMPPGLRSGAGGDLVVKVPATTGDVLVVLESARFVKPDGSIDVNYEAAHAGIISAVRLPKEV